MCHFKSSSRSSRHTSGFLICHITQSILWYQYECTHNVNIKRLSVTVSHDFIHSSQTKCNIHNKPQVLNAKYIVIVSLCYSIILHCTTALKTHTNTHKHYITLFSSTAEFILVVLGLGFILSGRVSMSNDVY